VLWNLGALRPAFMPIRAYLDGEKFDGETIRLIGIAFEMAVGSLGGTPSCDDPLRQALAQNIIALAKAGEQDPERLCEAALKAVRRPGRHRRRQPSCRTAAQRPRA
jgi:hypothetical protein